MRARKHKTVRNPLMTVMGTVEWSPNVRHENLRCGVCRTASLPPSLTGFSCHNAGDPRIGIVQRYPMLHIESVAGWRLKLALDYVRRDAKSGSVDEHRDCRCAF